MNLLLLAVEQIQKPLIEHKPDPNKKVEEKKPMTIEERRARGRAYAKKSYEKTKQRQLQQLNNHRGVIE